GRFCCAQNPLPSHPHYAFRLASKGVLLSWAVPKGPSLDPKTKRLAMHVEDHPFEYGTFEGVIPEGYGAGIVMLWDRGTWTPETDDVDAALKKGDLKFSLNGYKLKGSWVLVRTGGRYAGGRGGGDRSWLLIKHRDEWSGDVAGPEFTTDQFAVIRHAPEGERLLVLERVPAENRWRGPGRVGNDDVDLAANGFLDAVDGVGGREPEHAASLGQQVRDQNDRPFHLGERFRYAADEENRHQARVEA